MIHEHEEIYIQILRCSRSVFIGFGKCLLLISIHWPLMCIQLKNIQRGNVKEKSDAHTISEAPLAPEDPCHSLAGVSVQRRHGEGRWNGCK